MLIQGTWDSQGNLKKVYHFCDPQVKAEFERRCGSMSQEEAFSSMCTCAKHRCLAHGMRHDPYPFEKLPEHLTGAGMFIGQKRNERGEWVTYFNFSRPELEKELIRRIDEQGMSVADAYHSMCQCQGQICPSHGPRVVYTGKALADNPDLFRRYEQLLRQRFHQ
jgi:hypothetical protein